MDKLKYVRLENTDGSYSDPIALSSDTKNIDVGTSNLENYISVNDTNINNLKMQSDNNTNAIRGLASGSPLVASSTSEMIDTSHVYVNTTDGHWYYYNGSAWIDGGVYQAAEDSKTLRSIANNFEFTTNLYIPQEVELKAISDSAGFWQKYTLNNPTIGHVYAIFDTSLGLNYKSARFIQYNNNTVVKQYTGSNYASNPIEENCNKLVLINLNSSDSIPYNLMLLDMTNKNLSDVKSFIDSYDSLSQNSHLIDIEPNELKGSVPYNLYNPELAELDGSYQRNYIYDASNKKLGFYCQNNGALKRLTSSNNDGNYLIGIAYDSNHSIIGRYNNPQSDITLPSNAHVLECAIINTSNNPYNNIMFIDKSLYNDDDIEDIGFLPYSYFLGNPFNVRIEKLPYAQPYRNKRILSLGDSFTYMNYYGEKLAEVTGCSQTPRGYNGANIGMFVADKYTPTGEGGTVVDSPFNAELLNNYDIVTIMGGTNNYGRAMPLGTINDEPSLNQTVCGEIKRVIDKILTLKPDIKIVWCTQPYRIDSTEVAPGGYLQNNAGYTMEDLANKIVEVCHHYGIPVFDFYHNSNWNEYTVKLEDGALVENIYTYDGIHPKSGNGNGGELLGIAFGNFINTI